MVLQSSHTGPSYVISSKKVGVRLDLKKSGESNIIEAGHAQVIIRSENVKPVTGNLIRKRNFGRITL